MIHDLKWWIIIGHLLLYRYLFSFLLIFNESLKRLAHLNYMELVMEFIVALVIGQ